MRRRRNIRFADEPIFISPPLCPLQHILLVSLPQSGIHTHAIIYLFSKNRKYFLKNWKYSHEYVLNIFEIYLQFTIPHLSNFRHRKSLIYSVKLERNQQLVKKSDQRGRKTISDQNDFGPKKQHKLLFLCHICHMLCIFSFQLQSPIIGCHFL